MAELKKDPAEDGPRVKYEIRGFITLSPTNGLNAALESLQECVTTLDALGAAEYEISVPRKTKMGG